MDEKDRKIAHFRMVADLKTRRIAGKLAIRHEHAGTNWTAGLKQ
jgi:hypothetical protein